MTLTATFGAGGAEPYARALRTTGSPLLYLRTSRGDTDQTATMDVPLWNAAPTVDVSPWNETTTDVSRWNETATMDVSLWNSAANDTDRSLLRRVVGPVLDVGCGPGRMVRAAMDLGLAALGIDVSPTAVEIATDAGLNVIERSVFDSLPAEGQWQTVLLVDGNIGIGGDVEAMLRRCRELLAPGGEIVAEVDSDPAADRTNTCHIVDTNGHESAAFPWAVIGADALVNRAEAAGLVPGQSWIIDGRAFCRLAATAR